MNIPLDSFPDFPTSLIEPRRVDIWLPPEYRQHAERRFPVLYMHDGQNLFDPELAFTGVDWGVDEGIERLSQAGVIHPAIVVGIWNVEKRWLDYLPQRPLETPAGEPYRQRALAMYGGGTELQVASDRYLRFIVEELKPFVDGRYRTLPGREDTFVMGSSMGGLISLYALCEYPQVFKGAGCLSTHWPALEQVGVTWVREALPPAGEHRLYFDFGSAGLDALYEPFQQQVDEIMRQKGYAHGIDWLTCSFPGADHNEAAWRARVDIPLEFLLKVKR
jgi:predicted alpha/beta superfamily hydrolase